MIWELRGGRRLSFRALATASETSPGVLNTRLRELRAAGFVDLKEGEGFGLAPEGVALMEHLLPLYKWADAWAAALKPAARPAPKPRRSYPHR